MVKNSNTYEKCEASTGYDTKIGLDEIHAGTQFCVRTSEKRFAFITVTNIWRADYSAGSARCNGVGSTSRVRSLRLCVPLVAPSSGLKPKSADSTATVKPAELTSMFSCGS
jgi:hypothetical protein